MNSAQPIRIIVLASGKGSNFAAIADRLALKPADAMIVGLVCDRPGAFAIEHAIQRHIPVCLLDYASFENKETFFKELRRTMQELAPDYILLAGFMRILPAELVEKYQGKMVNIHPALLPKFPGLHTHERVLKEGEKFHGSSVHFVIPELDAGPIIAQSRLNIQPDDSPESLHKRIQALEHELYPTVVEWLIAGRVRMEKNTVLLDDEVLPPQGYQYAYDALHITA
jgi:phosphoribosylglycinamide formyltransferase-1